MQSYSREQLKDLLYVGFVTQNRPTNPDPSTWNPAQQAAIAILQHMKSDYSQVWPTDMILTTDSSFFGGLEGTSPLCDFAPFLMGLCVMLEATNFTKHFCNFVSASSELSIDRAHKTVQFAMDQGLSWPAISEFCYDAWGFNDPDDASNPVRIDIIEQVLPHYPQLQLHESAVWILVQWAKELPRPDHKIKQFLRKH